MLWLLAMPTIRPFLPARLPDGQAGGLVMGDLQHTLQNKGNRKSVDSVAGLKVFSFGTWGGAFVMASFAAGYEKSKPDQGKMAKMDFFLLYKLRASV